MSAVRSMRSAMRIRRWRRCPVRSWRLVASRSAGALQSDANAPRPSWRAPARTSNSIRRSWESVIGRLDALEGLEKKYGGSLRWPVLAARDRFASCGRCRRWRRDERLAGIGAELARLDAAVEADAAALRKRGMAAARQCEARVTAELRDLAMRAARVTVAVEPREELAARGADRIGFRFSANPGGPERPLARVASGGERSRLLLAVVVVLADADDARAFVFDEIDAGIGGATAAAVGLRLARLASVAQVACVTHPAQIAACADAPYALRKRADGDTTTIDAVALDGSDARRNEIARMLAGDVTKISLQHAAALLAGKSM